ncbi:manno protein [Ephemerocybe angulata]|uniref:Manno protein n=1 Tax=Ephemerocybe angulata TaxID=980116 RepID=A0A8H6HIS5_9AGAR|nr:manno protein [Tulosesus angulatus]
MIGSSSIAVAALLALSPFAQAQAPTNQFPQTPLADKRYDSPAALPYKVDSDTGLLRGSQAGFNICNSTTENQSSLCQTSYFNSVEDFCIWGPIEKDSTVADTEGEMVAWCSKPGHGTRLIPAGALTGIQWIKTPDYVQAVGFLDQSQINIKAGDWGGEMDPHGADLRGNPMGGVIFSTAFGGSAKQVIEWHNFVGGNKFCFKACDPAGPNAAHFCEHIYDRIGCDYNIPNAAQDKVFESCLGDNQDYPGVYTSNGQVMTYTQPAESLGAISTMPYTPKVPASSSCSTFESAKVYTGLPTAAATTTSGGAAATGSVSGSAGATSKAGTAVGAKATGTAAGNGAGSVGISLVSVMGVVFAGLFLS